LVGSEAVMGESNVLLNGGRRVESVTALGQQAGLKESVIFWYSSLISLLFFFIMAKNHNYVCLGSKL